MSEDEKKSLHSGCYADTYIKPTAAYNILHTLDAHEQYSRRTGQTRKAMTAARAKADFEQIVADKNRVEHYYKILLWAWRTGLALAVIGAIALIVTGCGEDGTCHAGPCYLVGDFTEEEARALTVVNHAVADAGFTPPGYAVNYVHQPDASFKGTTWAEWRIPGTPARNPAEGYRGYCDREWQMVFIRRYGEAEPYLLELLVHEITHAIGYDHDQGPTGPMHEAEARIWAEIEKAR